jgi:hypothetical protein
MTTSSPASLKKDASLVAALQHTTRHGLPCNSSIIAKISESSLEDPSTGERALKLLKQDLGLMIYCLRELLDEAHLQGTPIKDFHPIDVISKAQLSLLKDIVERAPKALFHKTECVRSYEQDRLLLLPIIAAVITQTLAPAVNLDPHLAFTTCLFRQLGLTLIAWNYPRIFTRAVTTAQTTMRPVDVCLAAALGFSPSALALALARAWHLAAEIRCGLGEGYENEQAKSLKRICSIGITLAKTEEPWLENIPSSQVMAATDAVTELLGDSGLSELKQAITSFCSEHNEKLNPDFLHAPNKNASIDVPSRSYRFERK